MRSHNQKKYLQMYDLQVFEVFETFFSGEGGIRTPGGLTLNGFQDRRIRPLCHLSWLLALKRVCGLLVGQAQKYETWGLSPTGMCTFLCGLVRVVYCGDYKEDRKSTRLNSSH